jgi:hypothetical protein
MADKIKISNISGGKSPYTRDIIGLANNVSETTNSVSTGIFRARVKDADGNVSELKTVHLKNPAHITDRKLNLEKIREFNSPNGIVAVWGWGSPRWLDELNTAQKPTDALAHGWTHTDNCFIDGSELTKEKRAKFIVPAYSAYNQAVSDVLVSNPNAVNIRLMRRWVLKNETNNPINFTYTDHTGATINDVVPPADSQLGYFELAVSSFWESPPNYDPKRPDGAYYHNAANASDADIIEVGKRYYEHNKWIYNGPADQSQGFEAQMWLFDEENITVWDANSFRVNSLILKGVKLRALADNNDLKIIYYGKVFTDFFGFYSGREQDGTATWKQKIFPHLTTQKRIDASTFNGWIHQGTLDAGIWFDGGFYLKVPMPMENSKYEKQNGAYRLDQDGERLYRFNEFSEVIRGENTTFRRLSQFGVNIGTDASYGYPSNVVGELFWAVNEMYSCVTRLLFLKIAMARKFRNNEDIYNNYTDPISPCAVVRDRAEGSFPGYGSDNRPLTEYQIEFNFLFPLIAYGKVYVWTSYNNVQHPNMTQSITGINARLKSQGYASTENPNGTLPMDFGAFEDMTRTLELIKWADEEYGVFTDSVFYSAYAPASISHEIIIMGRIKDNKVFIAASAPEMDYNETMSVVFSNKKNTFSRSFTVNGCKNTVQCYVLPTDTYDPKDLVFTYNDIYGQQHKVTGDLRFHIAP